MSWASDVERLLRTRWGAGDQFTLSEVYEFLPDIEQTHPGAQNVQARVRDAMQSLRQKRLVDFVGKGRYRLR
jgi:hypothetical protein